MSKVLIASITPLLLALGCMDSAHGRLIFIFATILALTAIWLDLPDEVTNVDALGTPVTVRINSLAKAIVTPISWLAFGAPAWAALAIYLMATGVW